MYAKRSLALVTALLLAGSPCALPALAADTDVARVNLSAGQVVLELVGQVLNLPPSADAPLGSSSQFGYVAFLKDMDDVFTDSNPANQNETTAMFTFFTEVRTVRSTTHGPFSIVIREGTTTLYRNTSPASFAKPDSFRSGTPIQTSSIRQQVILDTVERTFTVVNMNTITSTSAFSIGDSDLEIGKEGQMFRTSLVGVLFVRGGGTPPPTGHFAGYAVGVHNRRG